MKHILTFCLLLAGTLLSRGQAYQSGIKEGNKAFEKNVFDEAEIKYKQATSDKPDGFEGWFNLGDALYKQQRFDEALSAFQKSQETASTDVQKANALHNMGNVHAAQQQYQQAIEAYKNALRHNPNDDETRYNLAKALRELKQQQQQNKQDKPQEDQKDQQNQNKQQNNNQQQDQKDKAQNEQNDPMKENDQNEDAKKNEDQQQQDGEKQEQDQQPEDGDQEDKGGKGEEGSLEQQKMSKEEMEQLLEAIANAEKQTRAKLDKKKKATVKVKAGVKDW